MRAFLVFASVNGAERRATVWAVNKRQATRLARQMFPDATSIVIV